MYSEAVLQEIESHIKSISSLLGIEETIGNKDTPRRVAKMYYLELFKNLNSDLSELDSRMTTFPLEGVPSPVSVRDIPFSSVCEHHWMPFIGKVSVSYIPNENIIGLSKIPRVVKYFSKMPQLQERLTNDIGKYLVRILSPRYLKVEVNAMHTCVLCRGAESEASTSTVFEYRGTCDEADP